MIPTPKWELQTTATCGYQFVGRQFADITLIFWRNMSWYSPTIIPVLVSCAYCSELSCHCANRCVFQTSLLTIQQCNATIIPVGPMVWCPQYPLTTGGDTVMCPQEHDSSYNWPLTPSVKWNADSRICYNYNKYIFWLLGTEQEIWWVQPSRTVSQALSTTQNLVGSETQTEIFPDPNQLYTGCAWWV